MTGDVSIKPNSTCMVMTTEILRSMLYRSVALCPQWSVLWSQPQALCTASTGCLSSAHTGLPVCAACSRD